MDLKTYTDQRRGTQSEIARAIGVDAQLVWQWANLVRPVPLERCVAIERATGAAVRRWDLRPADWYQHWPELIGTGGAPDAPREEAAHAE